MPEATPVEPIHSTIAGVELVTIPVWHYAELLECQRTARAGGPSGAQMRAHPATVMVDPRSRLFGDPEVSVFLYEALGRMKLKDVATACRERFGAERSPSRATIGRFWERVRGRR